MGFDWSGIASAGIGLIGDLFGAESEAESAEHMLELQYEYQRKLNEQQNQYNVENYQHRHQWEVEDLRSSGLNPILSANSAGNIAAASAGSVGLPSAPKYDIGKSMERLANSALARKQFQLADYNSRTDRMRAEADMIRARQDEAKTQSAIELNQSQSSLNIKSAEMLEKNYDLNKLYMEANVREIDQRIINSVMEVNAKVQYLKESGQAALMSASAQQASAAASMKSAEAQQIIASVARENGISQRQLNDALEGKASAETKEAYERAAKVQAERGILDWQLSKDKIHNPYAESDGLGRAFMGVGEILRNGISGGAGFVP